MELAGRATIQSGFPFKSSTWRESGIPVVKIANVKQGRVDREGLGYVDELTAGEAKAFALAQGDVLIAMTGYVGEAAMVSESDLPLLLNQRVGRCNIVSADLDLKFLYFALTSPSGRKQLENLAQGSAQPNLSTKDFGLVEIPLPPLPEQRAIAEVLGALDDKIESNRRIVSLCEVLAHAFSIGLRNLPRAPLSEVASVSRVTENPTQFGDSPVDHFSIPAFDAGGSPEKIAASQIKSGKLRVKQRSVLVSRLNPGTPRVWVMAPDESPALCSTEFLVLSPLDNDSIGGVWLAVLGDEFTESMERRATGTSFSHQRIKQGDALTVQVRDIRLADRQLLAQADALLMEVIQQRAEIALLAQLRDTLLPALLSGRIRVPAAAELVEAP